MNFHSARSPPPSARTVLRPAWAAYIGGHFRPVKPEYAIHCAFLKPGFFKLLRETLTISRKRFLLEPSWCSTSRLQGFCWRIFRRSVRYRTVPRGGAKWPLFGCRSTPFSTRASSIFREPYGLPLTRAARTYMALNTPTSRFLLAFTLPDRPHAGQLSSRRAYVGGAKGASSTGRQLFLPEQFTGRAARAGRAWWSAD